MNRFKLQYGLFGKATELIITPEMIKFGDVMIDPSAFDDVKYRAESIQLYKFHIGAHFFIDIKYNQAQVLQLRFSKYPWRNRHYSEMYTEISRLVGIHYLTPKLDALIEILDQKGSVDIGAAHLTLDHVSVGNARQIPWTNVDATEYPSYFVVFDKSNPNHHQRISFNEWTSELLFNTLKAYPKA
jgi:hypothetical protein